MTSTYLVVVAVLFLVAAMTAIFLLLRLQQARLESSRAQERLEGKEQENAALANRIETLQTELQTSQQALQTAREDGVRLQTSLDSERKQTEEKLKILQDSRNELTASFKNLANEIFDEKNKKFTDSSKETLNSILTPLQDKIKHFEKRVEETYDKESKQRFSLEKEIKNLQELNSRISEDAVNLTNALKGDNKAQGTWGEFVLESILERSGLVKGREYEIQVSLKAEEGGKSQPDVVVHLPESRDIVIDSKVSLKAWDAYSSADDAAARQDCLKQHIQSIRSHVRGLSAKDYQNLAGINSLDYVLLFMPIEAAYSVAIQEDPDLNQFAFERNIIFVGPTTLLTTLKTVQNLWRLAQQNQNANEIALQAGRLYDKFVNFVTDLEKVGQSINTTQERYNDAFKKLSEGRGNLIKRAEDLKQLGAKTSKQHKSEVVGSALENDEQSSLPGPKDKGGQDSLDDADKKTRH